MSDAAAPARIMAALDRLRAGQTTVLTSHRPRLIEQAELVYVVEVGRVSERGIARAPKGNTGCSHDSCSLRGTSPG